MEDNTVQVTIEVPDNVPTELLKKRIKEIEANFKKEIETLQKSNLTDDSNIDPWDALDIESIAVDTGRTDGSINHDQYIYGKPKR